jgi:hypothetical protein
MATTAGSSTVGAWHDISEILAAAANRLEQTSWDPRDSELSISGAIQHVAPSTASAITAIRFFAQFVRTDGISWERTPGRTTAEVLSALRDAASVSR